MIDEIREVDTPVDVTTIIENHAAQIFHNRNGIAKFRVEDEELIAANGNGHLSTICSLALSTERHIADRPSFVNRETTKRGPAAGEEALASGYIRIGKRLC